MQNRVDLLSRIYILRGINDPYILGYRGELIEQIRSHLSELMVLYPWLPVCTREITISYTHWPFATLELSPRLSIRYSPDSERLRYPDSDSCRYLVADTWGVLYRSNNFQGITRYIQTRYADSE